MDGQGVPAHERAPIRTTLLERGERETRGRVAGRGTAEPPDHTADAAFMAAVRAYPSGAGDRLTLAYRIWLGFGEEERRLAAERMETFLAFRRGQGRSKGVPAFENYLRDRGFLLVGGPDEPGVAPGGRVMVEARKRLWFALLWRRIGRGERVALMISEAIAGRAWGTAPADLPDEAAERALVSIEAGGEEAAAWSAHLAAAGIRIGFRDFGLPFVWAPARWPPGHAERQRAERDAADLEAGF